MLQVYDMNHGTIMGNGIMHFDDTTSPTNINSMSEATEQIIESTENNLPSTQQESMEEVELVMNILESQNIDTSHTSRCPSQPCTDTDEKCQQVHHQNMLNKMQRHIRRTRNIHPKMLPESPLQFTQTRYLQFFFLLMSHYTN